MVRESFRLAVPPALALDCVVRLRRNPETNDLPAARCELFEHWRKVCG